MRGLKLLVSLSLIIFSVGIFGARFTNQLFPIFPIAVLISLVLLTPIIIGKDMTGRGFHSLLVLILFFGSSIRLFIYTFPVSMIAFDPDTFAISIQTIVASGHTEGVASTFYQNIPLFHIYTAMTSHTVSLRPADAMGIWPITVGILFPLAASIFALRLNNDFNSAITGATLMSILSNSVTYSFAPIPNLMGAALFIPLIVVIIISFSSMFRAVISANVLFIALLFTHKLHPFVTILILLGLVILQLFIYITNINKNGLRYSPDIEIIALLSIITSVWTYIIIDVLTLLLIPGFIVAIGAIYQILLLGENTQGGISQKLLFEFVHTNNSILTMMFGFGVLLLVQWTFITNLLYTVLVYRVLPLMEQQKTTFSTQTSDFGYASPVDVGLFELFLSQSDILIILLPVSYGFVYFLYHNSSPNSLVILSVGGVGLSLMPFGLFAGVSGGIGAPRALLVFSPIAIALASSFLFKYSSRIIQAVFILLLVFQTMSVGFVPDHPGTYRMYLTQEEVDGKEFGNKYINGQIYTDLFYYTESIKPIRNITESTQYDPYVDNKYRSIGKDLLERNINKNEYQTVAIRTDVTNYRTTVPTIYILTWSPAQTLGNTTQYDKIYANDGVTFFE